MPMQKFKTVSGVAASAAIEGRFAEAQELLG
jgi:hypothetical protein